MWVSMESETEINNVITNPPYNCAESFIGKGLELTRYKLALLLRLAFLEGVNRHNTIFSKRPPRRLGYGYLVNALPFTHMAQRLKAVAQLHMPGLYGIKIIADLLSYVG